MELVSCPTCGVPAEVEARSTLGSTDGPVEHVKVTCVRQHWYLMPRDLLDPSTGAEVTRLASRTG